MPDQSRHGASIVTGYKDLLEVNQDGMKYFQLTRAQKDTYCSGSKLLRCVNLITYDNAKTVPTSAIAIYQLNIVLMTELCDILFVNFNQPLRPEIFCLENSIVLLIKPKLEKFYTSCDGVSISKTYCRIERIPHHNTAFCEQWNSYYNSYYICFIHSLFTMIARVFNRSHIINIFCMIALLQQCEAFNTYA